MQGAIESFGQQLTHMFNVGHRHVILNGYQCYLKRMTQVIKDEVECSKALGFNLGVKLIRGAYMNEERAIAAASGVESPVWDSLQDTHDCYNNCMVEVMENLDQNSLLLLASHNADSVKICKNKMGTLGYNDTRIRFG